MFCYVDLVRLFENATSWDEIINKRMINYDWDAKSLESNEVVKSPEDAENVGEKNSLKESGKEDRDKSEESLDESEDDNDDDDDSEDDSEDDDDDDEYDSEDDDNEDSEDDDDEDSEDDSEDDDEEVSTDAEGSSKILTNTLSQLCFSTDSSSINFTNPHL